MITKLNKSMGLLLLCTSTSADVILDQIGPMDGNSMTGTFTANQYFESDYSIYDIATIDNFTIQEQTTITNVETVIDGWGGFADPSSITAYQGNVYSFVAAAGNSLVGDIATDDVDVADVYVSPQWKGPGFLVSVPTYLPVEEGMHWISVIPTNSFDNAGQTGVAVTLIGDGIMSVHANPNEGFGFGPWVELTTEAAFRIHDGPTPDPCSYPLPAICSSDVDQDGIVAVSDLLTLIAQWGDCGDGTFRPTGDVAPLPDGDCCVDIADLLTVVADWGADCTIYGACCLDDGVCDEMSTSTACEAVNGVYFGDDSNCDDGICIAGACCIDTQTCQDITEDACLANKGSYMGDETYCATTDCAAAMLGNECETSIVAIEGANPFDTTYMTPSQPQPDETMCSETSLDWANSQDIWFIWVAPSSAVYTIDTCDINSYDTSLVVYQDSCSNQIACNGDTESEIACQDYFSSIQLDAQIGSTYYIRIGGWNGETGSGTLNIFVTPPPVNGACCFPDETCIDSNEDDCFSFGGTFAGENTSCSEKVCLNPIGDECIDNLVAFAGLNVFDTSTMTHSIESVDEGMCPDTYLDWGDNNPDVWFHWTATDDGVATFTTCDQTSFDTSMVLYTGSCNSLIQIDCNGDAALDSNCQQYYSLIEYSVTAGTNYIIRLGGWQGFAGTGTLTITLVGENDTGACCVDGKCLDELTDEECQIYEGVWNVDQLCQDISCNQLSCQEAHSPTDNWFVGTSALDLSNAMEMERAELVNLAEISTVKVWGFQLFFTGTQWIDCSTDFDFHVRSYSDALGLPGKLSEESLYTPATKTSTGQLYGGVYELMEWEIPFSATNVEHLSVQSSSEELQCWFLWMSSGEGDSSSSVSYGDSWFFDSHDFSICAQ